MVLIPIGAVCPLSHIQALIGSAASGVNLVAK